MRWFECRRFNSLAMRIVSPKPDRGRACISGLLTGAGLGLTLFGGVSMAESFPNDPETKMLPNWDPNWDKKQPIQQKNSEDVSETDIAGSNVSRRRLVRSILLVRHGQYVYKEGSPDSERVLTELGKEQALLTGKRLASMNIKFDKVWVSTLCRALETADLVSSCLSHTPERVNSDLFREGCPVVPEPASKTYKPSENMVFQDSARIEAGFRTIFFRPDSAVGEDLRDDNDSSSSTSFELMIGHGNVIRYWTLRALQLDSRAWLRISLMNCSITWISVFSDGQISLRALGDTGHIPHEKSSYN